VALLSIRNVTRRFGGIVAIDDVSLDVDQGQIVGLIGPNGAGKTTLFNVITRLYKPDSGELEFDGKSLLRTPPHRIVRRGIARTFQNVELFRTMSSSARTPAPSRSRAAGCARTRARCSTTSASPLSRTDPWPACRSGR
jgi:branched-chain amino acid transport system ATP-binding protein